MERLLLHILRPQVPHALDPLQFAYQEKVGVEDAIVYLMHRAHSYLNKGKGAVRIVVSRFCYVMSAHARVFRLEVIPSKWSTLCLGLWSIHY